MRHYKYFFTLIFIFFLSLLAWRYAPLIEIALTAKPKPVTPRGDLMALEKSNIAIFNKTKDSVVYISTLQQRVDPWSMSIFEIPRGTGSGFIWDRAGHIVTNYHVIAGASRAMVRLSNGKDYNAILVGVDPAHDLAVLKIKTLPGVLKPVLIGRSSNLKVGQIVYAIGNPFGLDWTMTMGIISALDRIIAERDGAKIKHAIQTDAAINPGNSGGPLIDSAGRVIGINTAIYSPSGAYAGIGFAIPIDLVNKVVSSLIAYGRYLPPSLGIESDERINNLLQKRFGIKGVVVLDVAPNSPAAAAGLKPTVIYPDGSIAFGDIIVALDNKKVSSFKELQEMLENYHHSQKVILTLLRDGKKHKVEVTLK